MTIAVPNAEYVFGTHLGALVTAEAQKSRFFSSVRTPPVSSSVGRFILQLPQVLPDLQASFAAVASNAQGNIYGWQEAGPQDLPPLGSQFTASARAIAVPAAQPLRFQSAAPNLLDLTGWARFQAIAPNLQGRTPLPWVTSWQEPPWQLVAQEFSAAAPPVPVPVPLTLKASGPAYIDLGGSALIICAAFNPQGPTIRQLSGAPPGMDLVQPSWLTPAAVTPPVIITGPTVFPQPQSFAQPDLTINYSVVLTPSTFRPSAPVVVTTDTHDGLPKRKRKFDDQAQTQVIRESQLRPKKRPADKPSIQEAREPIDAPTLDTAAEEADLMRLIEHEDETLLDLVESAVELLRTLH